MSKFGYCLTGHHDDCNRAYIWNERTIYCTCSCHGTAA